MAKIQLNQIEGLQEILLQLQAALSAPISKIPDRRLRGMRARWIRDFLAGRSGTSWSCFESWTDTRGLEHISHRAPAGVVAAPDFTIRPDNDDDELLLANRAEIIASLVQSTYKSPTWLLEAIESCAHPLEQLAYALED